MNRLKFSIDVETEQPVLGTLPRTEESLRSMLDYKIGPEAFESSPNSKTLMEKVSDQLEFVESSKFGHFGIKRRPESESSFSEVSKRAMVVDYRWLKETLLSSAETYFALAGFTKKNNKKREEYKNKLRESIYITPRFVPLRRRREDGGYSHYLRKPDGSTKIYGKVKSSGGATSIVTECDYLSAPLFFNFGLMITNSSVISQKELLELLAVSQRIGIGGARKLGFGNFRIKKITKE